MTLLRKILFPFVPIYYLVTWIRNKFYDLELKKSKTYDFPVICVGNLNVGGTGKTPMIEYLIRLLKNDYKIATLSRGYKRKTNGFHLADKNSSVNTIGDEPFQFYNKFNKDIIVAVDENKQRGINRLRINNNKTEAILLDDAFQHRKVKAGLNILLTTYNDLYIDDIVLPTGNLREPRIGANRANIIVITKCPIDLSEINKSEIIKKIRPKPYQKVFFSSISYSNELFSENDKISLNNEIQDFTLVTGIANSDSLVDYLKSKKLKFNHLNFDDHYEFSKQDIQLFTEKKLIITTEKDYMRLMTYETLKGKLFYLPIKVHINDSLIFNKLINDFVSNYYAEDDLSSISAL